MWRGIPPFIPTLGRQSARPVTLFLNYRMVAWPMLVSRPCRYTSLTEGGTESQTG
jgi:hypothetical protein